MGYLARLLVNLYSHCLKGSKPTNNVIKKSSKTVHFELLST